MSDEVKEPLLRVSFDRHALNATDTPLQFVIHELAAIAERIPDDLKLSVATAQRIVVTIDLD